MRCMAWLKAIVGRGGLRMTVVGLAMPGKKADNRGRSE